MELLIVVILIIIVVAIFASWRQYQQKKCEEIKKQYPLAYNNYICKYGEDIAGITSKSDYYWIREEKRLRREQIEREEKRCLLIKKKEELKRKTYEISKKYPEGLKKWKRLNVFGTNEQIIQNELKIKCYEEKIKTSRKYDIWEKEQKEYSDKCLSVSRATLDTFGRYCYSIPFLKKDEDGNEVSGLYKIYQFFVGCYCLESDLDYSICGEMLVNNRIDEFKKCERHYVKTVYDKIKLFLKLLNESYSLSVYLYAGKEWNKESFDYHYKELFGLQSENIVDDMGLFYVRNAFDAYYPSIRIRKKHIVVIDIQTSNVRLKEVCKNIIAENQEKQPLIAYISLLKGFDREEMLNLIKLKEEKLNRVKEDEQKRQSLSPVKLGVRLEKFKTEKDEIIRVLKNNGIQYFYHFTDVENLNSIKKYGGLFSWCYLKQKHIDISFGGSQVGQDLDVKYGLQDYVRLSFCNDHPMMYRLQQDGIQLVLLKISIEVATWKDTLFSDMNATDNNHSHGGSLDDLKKVDFNAVKRNYVSRNDEDFKPHQAEIMVKTFVPIEYIVNIENPLYL